ncbi:conserved hypothetical protein [Ricinus communis]|uniref:Uncharacterized protein n=1 Tax=Ricinus communis TaxID=3988 RepID=B9TNX3_RICCO|nr:conserved hypothetical protein [Ricinus communis]
MWPIDERLAQQGVKHGRRRALRLLIRQHQHQGGAQGHIAQQRDDFDLQRGTHGALRWHEMTCHFTILGLSASTPEFTLLIQLCRASVASQQKAGR